jgi:PAS domain S-box-containing protein
MKTKVTKEAQAGGLARRVPAWSAALRYGAALLLCGIAAGINFAFPAFSAQSPFLPFYLATSVGAWFGGFRAGVLASVASVLVVDYYFTLGHGFNHDPITLVRMVIAGLIMTIISWLIDHRAGARQLVQTERGRVEDQQRRLQAMLTSAARIAGMGSWEYDIPNDRVVWDDETLRIFGTTRQAFGGNAAAFFAFVHPGDREALRAIEAKAFAGGGVTEMEYRIIRPDGSVRNIHDRGQVTRQEAGKPVQVTGMVMDITERRSLEEQLRQSQKMEAVGRLAGGVAHDFNNMLNVILGHCELLAENLPAGHPQQGRVDKIKEAAIRSANLTGQLLAFSRKQLRVPKVLDINATVGGLTSMLGSMIGDDIELVIRPGRKLGLVKADPGQIEQMVMNLAVNSRDAMPNGGQVVIETSNVEVGENLADHQPVPAGSYVMLAVSDTGCGIRPEIKDHIFEPFYTTKKQGQGTGLGLSMVYGIVEQSEGHIRVLSEPRRGTTFEIYLPRAEGPPETIAETAEEAILDGEETILIAEDELLLAELMHMTLESAGYIVLEAHNSKEAIALAQKHKGNVDLLLTDVVMSGGTNGLELAANLRSLRPGLKILYMTGYTADLIGQKGLAELQTRLLQKPFSTTSLRRKIRAVLDSGS